MNKQIIILLLIALIIGSISCKESTKKEYENADALFQDITKVYTLNKDGSIDYHYQHELDLRSYYAFNRLYGESFIVYNPDYQELKINKSVTETSEGKKVPSPDNAYNEVLPHFAEGAPPYSHLREMVVTHTGLEKNSTINFDYKLTSNKDFKPFLMENELLAKKSPIRNLTIKVRFPKGQELNYKLLNAEEKLNISNQGDFKEYKWQFNNISAIPHDKNQPEYKQHLPRLIFSTKNFEEAYSYFTEQLSSGIPNDINKKLNQLLEDKPSKLDSILAIQNMVINHMNHFEIPQEYKGYRTKGNKHVIENNGGNAIEKTNVLSSLLKKAGIDTEIVGIIPSEFYDEKIGNLKSFEQYYVKVQPEDETLYLSAIKNNAYNSKHEHSDDINLILNKSNKKPRFLEAKRKENRINVKGELTLEENNSLTGSVTYERSNCENPFLNIVKNKDYVKSLLKPGIPKSAISNFEIQSLNNETLKVTNTINHKISTTKKGQYQMIDIPLVNSVLKEQQLKTLVSERTAPLDIKWPLNINYDYTISLPETLELKNKNLDIEKKNDNAAINIQINEKDGKIKIQRYLEINNTIIPSDAFNSFKEIIDIWKNPNYKTLVLKEAEN